MSSFLSSSEASDSDLGLFQRSIKLNDTPDVRSEARGSITVSNISRRSRRHPADTKHHPQNRGRVNHRRSSKQHFFLSRGNEFLPPRLIFQFQSPQENTPQSHHKQATGRSVTETCGGPWTGRRAFARARPCALPEARRGRQVATSARHLACQPPSEQQQQRTPIQRLI